MGLIAFAGGKGSPGVTTTALALAAVWPRPVMVAECDPAGSDLAYRLHTAAGIPFQREPSLLSLAGASRRPAAGVPAATAEAYCQTDAGGVPVLRGPLSPEQAAGLQPYWPAIVAALVTTPLTVLADVGRLHPDNPALPVVGAADLVVLVARASTEGLAHLRDRVEQAALAGQRGALRLAAVVVDERSRGEQAVRHAGEVLAQTGIPVQVAGWLAVDRRGVDALAAGVRPRRSPLFRTARTVAATLLATLGTDGQPEPTLHEVNP